MEAAFVRLFGTLGIVGVGVAIGAILAANDVAGWLTGLAVVLWGVVSTLLFWGVVTRR